MHRPRNLKIRGDAMQQTFAILLLATVQLFCCVFDILPCSAFDTSSQISSSDVLRRVGAIPSPVHRVSDFSKRPRRLKGGQGSNSDLRGVTRNMAREVVSKGSVIDSPKKPDTKPRPLRIFCATWNVNGKPPLMPLKEWLVEPAAGEEVDVYLIGFQEVQDLKLQGALLTDEGKGRIWARAALHAVGALPAGPRAPYRCVAARQMVGMSLVVLARAGLAVDGVAVAEAGTGFMNQGGNKGAVAARFCAGGLSFCCVCSHLAASSDNVERRNQARGRHARSRRGAGGGGERGIRRAARRAPPRTAFVLIRAPLSLSPSLSLSLPLSSPLALPPSPSLSPLAPPSSPPTASDARPAAARADTALARGVPAPRRRAGAPRRTGPPSGAHRGVS